MKILFIYPNNQKQLFLPLGIASLSAFLKRAGHQTALFDTTFYDCEREIDFIIENLKKKINDFDPDLLAFSCTSLEYPFALALLEGIRQFGLPSIFGGPHPTVSPDKVIDHESIRMICIGEGEETLLEIVDKLSRASKIQDIPNLWVKNGNNQVIKNPVRPLIQNLDALPFPDWELFDVRHLNYRMWKRPFNIVRRGIFEMSRGCPYACTYCINPHLQQLYKGKGKYHREKNVDRFIEEVRYFRNKYDFQTVYFADECFFSKSIDTVEEFSRKYKDKIGLPFTIMARPEAVTKEKVDLFKKGGCYQISIGIESGNEKFRKELLNRHMRQEKIVDACKIAREAGLRVYTFNMVGLPYEDRGKIFETINLNRKANPHSIQVTIFYPFEGTKLGDMCVKNGLISKKDNQLTGYYEESILDLPELSREQIKSLHRTFLLYCRMPKIFYPFIRLIEIDNHLSNLISRAFRLFFEYGFYSIVILSRRLWAKLKRK